MKKLKKEEEIEESWNKKRVGIGLMSLLLLIAGLVLFLKSNLYLDSRVQQKATNVLSDKREKLEDVIQGQIEAIKEQALNIDTSEIASSSPQIRRLINDLKSLQDYPKSQIKKACEQICNRF